MISASSTHARPISLQTARMIWVMFLTAACGFIVLGQLLRHSEPQNISLPADGPIGGIAGADLLVAAVIRRKLLARSQGQAKRGDTKMAQRTWGAAQAFGFAAAMSVILVGFLLSRFSAGPTWHRVVLYAAGLFQLAYWYPQWPEPAREV
jgi:hypothetical protein